jgi:hypothetical protein
MGVAKFEQYDLLVRAQGPAKVNLREGSFRLFELLL